MLEGGSEDLRSAALLAVSVQPAESGSGKQQVQRSEVSKSQSLLLLLEEDEELLIEHLRTSEVLLVNTIRKRKQGPSGC